MCLLSFMLSLSSVCWVAYSTVPNKRGSLIDRGLEKILKFNKPGSQNKREGSDFEKWL